MVIDVELGTPINNSIFILLQNFKVEKKQGLGSFIFLGKINRTNFYGLNLVKVEKEKKIQNTLYNEPFLQLFLNLEPHVKSKNSLNDMNII